MPDKTFHYVASYMLKGYAMEKNGIAEKYWATSYKSLKRKIPLLLDILDNAYGKSYCQISNPTLVNNEVDLSLMSRLQLRAICLMLRVPAFWTSSLAAW